MHDRLGLLALLVTFAAGVAAAAIARNPLAFVTISAAYVLAQLIPIPSRSRYGVSAAPGLAAAVALLTRGSPVYVLGTAAVSLPLGWAVVNFTKGRRASDLRFPAEPVGIAVFGGLYGLLSLGSGISTASDPVTIVAFVGCGIGGFLASVVTRAALSAERVVVPHRLLRLRSLEDWPALALLYAAAALYSMTVPAMGPWSLVLAGLPYSLGHVALRRAQRTRDTYGQTIGALGRIPEAAGMGSPGHAGRTSDLALAVAGEMGLSGRSLDRLQLAGVLHDLGRVVLGNPSMAGKSLEQSDVARWSAAIIGEAKELDRVAAIVAGQHESLVDSGRPPIESQVVRLAATYDDEVGRGRAPSEALETLAQRDESVFDPEVLAALRRVLRKRSLVAG